MLGKILLTADAVMLLCGAPIADMSQSHMYNPRWPPHAKFHNGQTITLSVILGLATLVFTWRSVLTGQTGNASTPAQQAARRAQERDDLRTAAFLGSIYWLAGIAALLYPGTDGIDPEFGPSGFPQGPIFVGSAVAAILGWLVEGLS